jgi:hypothetical protein
MIHVSLPLFLPHIHYGFKGHNYFMLGPVQIDLDISEKIVIYSEIVIVPPLWASEELMYQ